MLKDLTAQEKVIIKKMVTLDKKVTKKVNEVITLTKNNGSKMLEDFLHNHIKDRLFDLNENEFIFYLEIRYPNKKVWKKLEKASPKEMIDYLRNN